MNHIKGLTAAMHLFYSVSTCTKDPLLSFISISINQNLFLQLKPYSSTANLISSPPCSPEPLPDFQASFFTLPWKKKKKITGMLKLQRAPQHCGKPSPLSQPLNLFLSFVCLFFVCYFSAVQTTARGSDRVYFDDKKNGFLCNLRAQLFWPSQ